MSVVPMPYSINKFTVHKKYQSREVWRYQRVIRSRKLKKDRQHNDQRKKDKRANNGLQNTRQKTKDRATQIPLISRCEFKCSPERVSNPIHQMWHLTCYSCCKPGGHFWHSYSIRVIKQIMMVTIKLSKWWLQLDL